jgi:hypothetical protein
MRSTTIALAASLALTFTGAALAQGTASPGPTGGNSLPSGSVRSDTEMGVRSGDIPATTGTVAPAAPAGAGSGAAAAGTSTSGHSGGANTSSGPATGMDAGR